eukprot:1160404-Pelagomonas_calceolata.AAC.5
MMFAQGVVVPVSGHQCQLIKTHTALCFPMVCNSRTCLCHQSAAAGAAAAAAARGRGGAPTLPAAPVQLYEPEEGTFQHTSHLSKQGPDVCVWRDCLRLQPHRCVQAMLPITEIDEVKRTIEIDAALQE